jgi:hypothetical protein
MERGDGANRTLISDNPWYYEISCKRIREIDAASPRFGGQGKSLASAFSDIATGTNFAIALISAGIGYAAFEYLRKRL